MEIPHGSSAPPAPAAPAVPGYAVDRLLGAGASGMVWLVHDDAGTALALKVPAGAGSRGFEARREVNVLARLEHPNLVRLHGVAETDRGDGLLTGYAAGGSAAALVGARGAVSPGEAVSILVGIAGALEYLHARGAVHGDISPGNILFTAEGKPQLADFGQARLLGEPGNRKPGTPGFEAPELAPSRAGGSGSGNAPGAPADIFALAAVGWFLLTGNVPPEARDRPPLSILVPGVGRELPALLEAGLCVNPAERPSAAEFAAAAYRGAPARPVDLVASAHPDVLPHLLTRVTGSVAGGAGDARSRWRRKRGRLRRRNGTGTAGRHRDRQRGDVRRRSGRAVPVALTVLVAAVLALAGIALAAPDLLRADSRHSQWGNTSGSPRTAPAGSPRTAPDGGAAQASQPAAAPGPAAPTLPAGTPDPAPAAKSPDQAAARMDREVEALIAQTAAPDPALALPALTALRARAFGTADPDLLAHVNAPDSPALLADRAQVDRLASDGQVLRGLDMQAGVLAAGPEHPGAETAVPGPQLPAVRLRVGLEVSSYQRVDTAGAVLEEKPAQQQEVVLILSQSEGMWRISAVFAPE